MSKKQQAINSLFYNAICLGKEVAEEKSSEILYKSSIDKNLKEKIRNKMLYELQEHLSPAEILYSSIEDLKRIKYFLYKNKTPNESKEYIKQMLLKHAKNVGEIQAVKDLQRGLNILNKNRRNSPLKVKNLLEEDGIFEQNTNETLDDICKNYSLNVIKKYFLKGILNNIIFDTKNEKNIDSKKLLDETTIHLRSY